MCKLREHAQQSHVPHTILYILCGETVESSTQLPVVVLSCLVKILTCCLISMAVHCHRNELPCRTRVASWRHACACMPQIMACVWLAARYPRCESLLEEAGLVYQVGRSNPTSDVENSVGSTDPTKWGCMLESGRAKWKSKILYNRGLMIKLGTRTRKRTGRCAMLQWSLSLRSRDITTDQSETAEYRI